MERYHFAIKQKLQILDLVRTGQLYRLASQFPSVTQKQINEWERKENQMRALSEKDQQSKYILHSGPSPMRKELFQFLYQTVKDLRSDRRAVTVDYLISIAETEDPSIQQLSYSGKKSMIRRFMDYFNLSIRVVTGTSGSNEYQLEEEQKVQIENFKAEYIRLVQTHQIPADHIFNMDQTGIYYENPVSKTIEFSGSREVPVETQGDEKKRITLFSLINAKGQLFPQLLVFKGARDARVHKEVSEYDDWATLHTVQPNAWCDGLTLIEWIYRVWHPLVRHISGPKLLILDSYPLHQDLEAKFGENNTHVLFVPKGLTWTLQPLDCGFFKLLKDELKKLWIRNQQVVFSSEKAKREAVSSSLKTVFELQVDNDHSIFWKKAGLEPPHVYLPREDQGSEIFSQEAITESSAMEVEESSNSNLFAENI